MFAFVYVFCCILCDSGTRRCFFNGIIKAIRHHIESSRSAWRDRLLFHLGGLRPSHLQHRNKLQYEIGNHQSEKPMVAD